MRASTRAAAAARAACNLAEPPSAGRATAGPEGVSSTGRRTPAMARHLARDVVLARWAAAPRALLAAFCRDIEGGEVAGGWEVSTDRTSAGKKVGRH